MAKESSKLFFLTLPVLSSLLEESPGQGWSSLQNPPKAFDGILRDRFQGNFLAIGDRNQELATRLEADPFPDLRRDDDLTFGESSNYWHIGLPGKLDV